MWIYNWIECRFIFKSIHAMHTLLKRGQIHFESSDPFEHGEDCNLDKNVETLI